jgi:hypothetical protein
MIVWLMQAIENSLLHEASAGGATVHTSTHEANWPMLSLARFYPIAYARRQRSQRRQRTGLTGQDGTAQHGQLDRVLGNRQTTGSSRRIRRGRRNRRMPRPDARPGRCRRPKSPRRPALARRSPRRWRLQAGRRAELQKECRRPGSLDYRSQESVKNSSDRCAWPKHRLMRHATSRCGFETYDIGSDVEPRWHPNSASPAAAR